MKKETVTEVMVICPKALKNECTGDNKCHHREEHPKEGYCELEWYGTEKGNCPSACIPVKEPKP